MHLLPSPGTRPADGSFSYQIEEGSTLVKVRQYHYTDEHDFGYGNPKGEYTIPNVVSGYVKDENEDTYRYVTCPITCVGLGEQGNSFTELTAVSVSEGVVRIDRAFKGCDKLRSVKLPSTMRTIDSAFYGCSSLQSIVIPDQVYDVGSQSFYGCTQLQRVTMPSALAKIGDQTFANCESLVELILPETCQSMGDGVFKDCAVLEYVDLGSCKNIGVSAFSGCTNLAGVVSVAAVTNIANSAFYNCGMLENMTLPSGLTSIGDNAFYQCIKLHGLVFPKGLLHVGSGAFNYCSAIEEIVFSDGLLHIGANAFRNCAGIRKVRIPGTITNMGAYAVSSLSPTDLSEATLWSMDYSSVTNLVMLDGATAFGDYQTTSRHSALKRVELASSVVKINAQALFGCENLSEVAIRGMVESVGNKAFYNCSSLSEVPDFGGGVTNWGTEVFSGCTGLKKVVVPGSMKDIPSKMFYNCSGISELIIEEGVESSRSDSFLYDYNIRSLSLPSTLTNIANVTVNTAPRVSEVVTCHQEVPPANLNKAFLKNFTGILYYPPQYRSAWEAYLQEKGLSSYGKTWAEATENDPGEVNVNGVYVTYWWLAKYKLTESSTPEQAAGAKTGKTDSEGNDMLVWQDYVAGTDPTDSASVFTAVIAVTNSKVYVSWSPNLNDGKVERIYKLYGRTELGSGEWETPIQAWHCFFKVAVAMPTGEAGEETDAAGDGFVPGKKLGGVQLWENGPYWAECNVGASKPEEYGYYFWWGDTVGYTREGGTSTDGHYYSGVTWVSSTGMQNGGGLFGSNTCPTYGLNNSQLQSAGYIDSTGNLVPEHDAATVHLGTPWRIPTDVELSALINNCDTTWTTQDGVYGRLVKGRGAYASKSIFLPAAGFGGGPSLNGLETWGYYLSSTPHSDDSCQVWNLSFYLDLEDYFGLSYHGYRYYGRSVRPLRGFAK